MTEHAHSADLTGLVTRYLDIWNDTHPTSRLRRIETVFASDGRYVDPMGAASGHGEFDQLVHGAQQQFPGLTFRPGRVFDAHHDLARFTWELVADPDSGDDPIAVGFDVVEIDDAGLISRVSGFLDSTPA